MSISDTKIMNEASTALRAAADRIAELERERDSARQEMNEHAKSVESLETQNVALRQENAALKDSLKKAQDAIQMLSQKITGDW